MIPAPEPSVAAPADAGFDQALLPFHAEASAWIGAPVEAVFACIDDHRRLAGHMRQPSWRMGGGSMQVELDSGLGLRAGSHIRLRGRVFGIALSVEEVVTERIPPLRKCWQTIATPRLLVIGHYRMGCELTPWGKYTRLRVFIDYALPVGWVGRWLGRWFAPFYARWCTQQMLDDTINAFAPAGKNNFQGDAS